MKIAVLGAGAWGTALAVSAAPRHQVTLWARDAAQSKALADQRVNARYLPDMALPDNLQLAGGAALLQDTVRGQDLIIIATPMSGLRGMLLALGGTSVPVAWLCKGFETPQKTDAHLSFGLLAHEIHRQVAPHLIAGVLSGPSFAQEVARGQPTALVAASEHATVRDALVAAFHSPTLRVYANDVGSMGGTDSSINRQDPRIVDLSPAAFKQLYGGLDRNPGRVRVRIDPNQRGQSPSRVKP